MNQDKSPVVMVSSEAFEWRGEWEPRPCRNERRNTFCQELEGMAHFKGCLS